MIGIVEGGVCCGFVSLTVLFTFGAIDVICVSICVSGISSDPLMPIASDVSVDSSFVVLDRFCTCVSFVVLTGLPVEFISGLETSVLFVLEFDTFNSVSELILSCVVFDTLSFLFDVVALEAKTIAFIVELE